MLCARSCGQAYTVTGERAGRLQTTARKQVDRCFEVGSSKLDIGNIGNCAWSASTGQIKVRVVLPEVRNWHGKGSCCGKLTQCCQKASWQCFERSRRFPLAATSLLILLHHDGLMLLSLDVHVVQKVMWAGTQGLESVQDAFKQPQESR